MVIFIEVMLCIILAPTAIYLICMILMIPFALIAALIGSGANKPRRIK